MAMRPTLALALAGLLSHAAGVAMAEDLQLTGILRDFKRGDRAGGHPDFETAHTVRGHGDYGLVNGLVTMYLGEDGKPVYNPSRPSNDTIQSAQSLYSWYNDVPDVNISMPFTLTLKPRSDNPSIYSVEYTGNKQFFPLDGQGFGNEGLSHNYHFTFELKSTFAYAPGQRFTFVGDDDVWVYVNGTKVIDLGGVHSAETGSVLLFDGKAFVEKNHFPKGGIVKEVSSSMANELATKWSRLGMSGTCPIRSGDRYIDLDLTKGGADVRCEFETNKLKVWSSSQINTVVLKLANGMEVSFDNQSGYSRSYTAQEPIIGAWVTAGGTEARYYTPKGSSDACSLHFFFAERHTTESNFRIDTSIYLVEVPPTSISPLYD